MHSERLHLRALKNSDMAALSALRSDDEVNRYVDRPKTCNLVEAEAFIRKIQKYIGDNQSVYWVITTADNDDLIGTICLWNFSGNSFGRAEIGYELMPAWQGKGVMREAAALVISYAFSVLHLGRIIAFSEAGNTRSARLLQGQHFLKDERHEMIAAEAAAGYEVFYLPNRLVK